MKKLFLFTGLILFLPSCVQYFDWYKCTFTGGQRNLNVNLASLQQACPYLCSMAIYHQFQTIGLFNALWLTRDSISAYAQLRANRLGLSCAEQNIIIQKKLEKIKNKLVFYILMPKLSKRSLIKLDDYSFPWAVYLNVSTNGYCNAYQPTCIKKVYNLAPEYRFIFRSNFGDNFGDNQNRAIRYRDIYKVEFELCPEVLNLLNPEVALVISSVEYKTNCCSWDLPVLESLNSYIR